MYTINAHAKVNIFLKITGYKDGYHTLLSRFARVEDLYDTIEFIPCKCKEFIIEGCNNILLESNTIYKAYKAFNDFMGNDDIEKFFLTHKVVVTKRIPSQAGLGGGSSDGAAFMRLVKEVCNIDISTEELAKLGGTIGADFPFFIYNYSSANVSGFGEKVELFEEEPLNLEIYTPSIACDTAEVYKTFNKYLLQHISLASFFGWNRLDSRTILSLVPDPIALNDLYPAAMIAYPELEELEDTEGWFFSGSGSSFFKLK